MQKVAGTRASQGAAAAEALARGITCHAPGYPTNKEPEVKATLGTRGSADNRGASLAVCVQGSLAL